MGTSGGLKLMLRVAPASALILVKLGVEGNARVQAALLAVASSVRYSTDGAALGRLWRSIRRDSTSNCALVCAGATLVDREPPLSHWLLTMQQDPFVRADRLMR